MFVAVVLVAPRPSVIKETVEWAHVESRILLSAGI
jgi:hypothetical protein